MTQTSAERTAKKNAWQTLFVLWLTGNKIASPTGLVSAINSLPIEAQEKIREILKENMK